MSILIEKIMDPLLLSLLHFHIQTSLFFLPCLQNHPSSFHWETQENHALGGHLIQQFPCKGVQTRSQQVELLLASWVGPELRRRRLSLRSEAATMAWFCVHGDAVFLCFLCCSFSLCQFCKCPFKAQPTAHCTPLPPSLPPHTGGAWLVRLFQGVEGAICLATWLKYCKVLTLRGLNSRELFPLPQSLCLCPGDRQPLLDPHSWI